MRSAFPARSTPGTRSCATTARWGSTPCCSPRSRPPRKATSSRPRIAFDWKNQFEKLKNGTNTERYLLPHGKPAVAGDVIRQPELGKTLRAIAGTAAMRSTAARSPPTWSNPARHRRPAHAGRLCRAFDRNDLADRHHVQGPRRLAVPAERPGITMLVMLNILSRFDLTKFKPLSVERFHLEAEAAHRLHDARAVHRRSRAGSCRCRRHPRQGIRRGASRTSRWTGCSICRTSRRR